MKKISVLCTFILLFSAPIMAQNAKHFTLEEVMPGGKNYHRSYPTNKYGLKWWGDVCIDADIDEVKTLPFRKEKSKILLTLNEVNQRLEEKQLGKISHFWDSTFPYNEPLILIMTATHQVLMDWEKKQIVWSQPLVADAKNYDWNKDSRALAYTMGNQLFVTTADGQSHPLSNEPQGVVVGQSVHRNEFGITKGTFWSPRGNRLAFYRMDERMVTDYPQVDISTRIATLVADKYPMAGMKMHKVTIGIYDIHSGKTIYLQAGDPTDRYFPNISWSPDESKLYVIELNRDQNHAQLVRYDATTGKKEATLIEETHDKYVEPQHPITFLPWDKHKFIYQSQQDGYNHLYLYDDTGKQIRQITKGDWIVLDIVGFDTKNKSVIITSTEHSPLENNPYIVQVNSGKRSRITPHTGVHSVSLSASGRYLIDKLSAHDVPRSIAIYSTGQQKELKKVMEADLPMADYEMPQITVGTLKAADGKTDLYYRLVKPTHFDPNKKYPAILYVYGGPHAQMIRNSYQYDARGWDLYMAQEGYVVLTVDNRGSSNRGLEFENCTFRQLGTEEMKDQIKGVEWLIAQGFVDASRIGVHGWSFGGFMTINLMLTYPEVFKMGVAGGPVIDWKYYEVMYGERYMDTPQQNPEGYKKANLNLRAGNLKGKLQLIIGGNDPTCVPQHSLSFIRASIDAETQPDFFIYPGDEHNMFGRDRVHLYQRISSYFKDNL